MYFKFDRFQFFFTTCFPGQPPIENHALNIFSQQMMVINPSQGILEGDEDEEGDEEEVRIMIIYSHSNLNLD